ncbi:MAG: PKD domain-containing protein [Verrucomicrobia bacterium]|nr:PKD domain-containing protein [Verrucomicrobiota bacterium]
MRLRLLLPALWLCFATAASSATITIVNLDGANEGFNDPTPATPVGGNNGTTVGQQRLNVFSRAAEIWGARLVSNVPILVEARFDPLSCSESSGVLGSAGPTFVFRDFANAPVASTWYTVAQANALAGVDLAPDNYDISATFNSELGKPGCLSALSWYYGFDGNAPANGIDLLDTVLHEIAHGLGFATFVNLSTGAKFLGFDDAYMRHLENHSTGMTYPQMSNAQRLTASTSTGNLHWVGPYVLANIGILSSGTSGGHVRMYAPNPAQSGSSVSHWDTALSPDELMEPFLTATTDYRLTIELLKDIGWTVVPPPVVNFTASPTNGMSPLTVYFTNLSTGATSYLWNFGDGKTSTSTNPVNTYSNAGSYTVNLTAINPAGSNVLVRSGYVVLSNASPVLAPIADEEVVEAMPLVFAASAQDPDVLQSLTFSLDAGAPAGAAINPSSGEFTWTPTSEYAATTNTITVRVTDNAVPSASDAESFDVVVVTQPRLLSIAEAPEGSFTLTWRVHPGREYQFQTKTAITNAVWTDLGASFNANSTNAVLADNAGVNEVRFYRVLDVTPP